MRAHKQLDLLKNGFICHSALLPSPFSGCRKLCWAQMGWWRYSLGVGACEAGPSTGQGHRRGVFLWVPPLYPSPVPLALPSVPVLLRNCQHRPQLPGGTLPVPCGLWYPVLGHPQWGGCLCDSGHWWVASVAMVMGLGNLGTLSPEGPSSRSQSLASMGAPKSPLSDLGALELGWWVGRIWVVSDPWHMMGGAPKGWKEWVAILGGG